MSEEGQGVVVHRGPIAGTQSFMSANLPRLNGKNYMSWKEMMDLLLEVRGLKSAIEQQDGRAVEVVIDLQARLLILETLDESHRAQVRGCSTAREIFARLKLIYNDTSAANVYRLLLKYYRYEKKAEDSMSEHIGRMDEMRNQLADLGEKQSEQVYQVALIGSLPSEYSSIMEIWELTHKDMRTTPNLVSRLLKREEDLKKNGDHQALVTRQARPKLTKDEIDEKKKITKCKACGKVGHWYRECPSRGVNDKTSPNQSSGRGTAAMTVREPVQGNQVHEISFCVTDELGLKDSWISDSGASAHMCNNLSWFEDIELFDKGRHCVVGDGNKVEIKGIGNISIVCGEGKTAMYGKLHGVLYMPDLATNLFSIGAAGEKGNKTSFDQNSCVVTRGSDGQVLVKGTKEKGMYVLSMRARAAKHHALAAKDVMTLTQFHRILGHASSERVRKLLRSVGIEPRGSLDIECSDCPEGKGRRASHPSRNVEADKPGVVHVDLSGVNKVALNDFAYYLLAKDMFTEFVMAYFCKTKAEVPQVLARLCIDFENLSGFQIRELHTDNGTEFINKVTRLLCLKEKITHVTSAPYCPQQNGRIEREMQTITQSARTMLRASTLPIELWKEAISCAVYIKNRLPTSKSEVTPLERFTKMKPKIDHLVEFGVPVHIIVNDKYLSKWDSRTEPGFIVGYTSRTNTYRVFTRDGKIKETCDVIFDKHKERVSSEQTGKREEDDQNVHVGACQGIGADSLDIKSDTFVTATSGGHNSDYNGTVGKNGQPYCTGPRLENFFRQFRAYANDDDRDTHGKDDSENIYQNIGKQMEENGGSDGNSNHNSSLEGAVLTDEQSSGSTSTWSARPTAPPPLPPRPEYENETRDHDQQTYYCLNVDEKVPSSYGDATSERHRNNWSKPIEEEISSLIENETWHEVDWPKGIRPLTTKWVFAVKTNKIGEVVRHKARLVVRGFEQRYGIDYEQTFAPVAKLDSVRIVLAVAATRGWFVNQFDISSAFLHGTLKEEVYIRPPEGCRASVGKCFKLDKALYGLKQAPRAWNSTFNSYLSSIGLEATLSDPCVYTHTSKKAIMIVYVDDGLVISESKEIAENILSRIQDRFKTRLMDGTMFLGLGLEYDGNGIRVSQQKYILDIIEKFNLTEAKLVPSPLSDYKDLEDGEESKPTKAPYRSAIGCLNYLACGTRPDIAFATNCLAQFNSNPRENHWAAVKRIIKYLKGTKDIAISYNPSRQIELSLYSDADWGKNEKNRRSVSGAILLLNGSPIIFLSRRQKSVSLSSTEAEYISACEAVKELKWATQLLTELEVDYSQPTLFVDNQSAIRQIQNSESKRRSKHIDIAYHFVRQEFERGKFNIKYIESENQLADHLTKPLGGPKLAQINNRCKMTMKKFNTQALMMCMIAALVAYPTQGIQLQYAEPLRYIDSEYQAMEGTLDLKLDIALVSPCRVDVDGTRNSSLGVTETMVQNLKSQCEQSFSEVLDEVKAIGSCLENVKTRPKRIVPLIITGAAAISIACGGSAAVSFFDPKSSYNRLNEYDTWRKLVETQTTMLERNIEMVRGDLNLGKELRSSLLSEIERDRRLVYDTKQAILDIAQSTPAIAWEATRIFNTLHEYKLGLKLINQECRSRRLSIEGIFKMAKVQSLANVKTTDTYINELKVNGRETISFSVLIDLERQNHTVYRTLGLGHWRNVSSEPVFVTYGGPELVIYNHEIDCLATVVEGMKDHLLIYQTCTEPSYKDKNIDTWLPVSGGDESIKAQTKPTVVKIGNENLIYCLYENITIMGREMRCPTKPFILPRAVSFNFKNISYTAETKYASHTDLTSKILIDIPKTKVEYEQERDMLYLKAIKDKNDNSVSARTLDYTKGTLTIPTEYLITMLFGVTGLIASAITILRCCYRTVDSGPRREIFQDDSKREESHREQINLIVNPGRVEENTSTYVPFSEHRHSRALNILDPYLEEQREQRILELFKRMIEERDGLRNAPVGPPRRLPPLPPIPNVDTRSSATSTHSSSRGSVRMR